MRSKFVIRASLALPQEDLSQANRMADLAQRVQRPDHHLEDHSKEPVQAFDGGFI